MDILKWIWTLLNDQRGEIGDIDDSAGDSSDDNDKGDQDESEDEDADYGDIDLELEDEGEEEEAKVTKEELEDLKRKASSMTDLEKKIEKLEADKKNLNKALHEERQSKKKDDKDKSAPLSKAQLRQILTENKDDPDVLFNMVEYLAEQAAEGKATDAVKATEITQKQKDQKEFLTKNYPKLFEDGSDIRLDVDKTKQALGIDEHPYGDYFAVATRVLEDLPQLLQAAYKQGETAAIGKKAETARQEAISKNKLTKDTVYGKAAEGMSDAHLEAAQQMGLSKSQLKYFKQIVGKNPRTISVGD